MRRTGLVASVALAACTLCPSAHADVTRVHRDNGASEYFFDADGLAANGYETLASTIRRRPGTVRVLLIRPRVEFVGELSKSVEQL
ncbi:MAG TPA: hypothetical protein PLU22_08845 [Polyangiaceae bacterium]|nr:hypothetical protein [Polyangiaceae bacterium]